MWRFGRRDLDVDTTTRPVMCQTKVTKSQVTEIICFERNAKGWLGGFSRAPTFFQDG